jgi:hypothetical protein
MVPGGVRFSEIKAGSPNVEEGRVGALRIKNKSFEIGDHGGVDE